MFQQTSLSRAKERQRDFFFFWGMTLIFLFSSNSLYAASSQVMLKDGRVIPGGVAPVESVAIDPNEKRGKDELPYERILVIDDTLRQTYVGKRAVLDIQPDDIGASLESFKLHQPTAHAHDTLAAIGHFRASAVPFDQFGRRTVEINGVPVVQGITEITPRAIHAEGITVGFDMRISPLNFQRETLTKLIKRGIDPESLDDRLRVYQFYVQAELFDEAAEEMAEIVQDFHNDPDNGQRLAVGLRQIRQLAADRLLGELEFRRAAGQHRKVRALLDAFEEQGVSFERIQAIRKMKQDSDALTQKKETLITEIRSLADRLDNAEIKNETIPIIEEIEKELNPNTLERFSEFELSANDSTISGESRLALAISSWVGGNIAADTRLEIALSMYRVRKLVRKFLLDRTLSGRTALWDSIRTEEAATPDRVARILYLMKPPLPTKAGDKSTPGEYEIETESYASGQMFHYRVQLPPEYDPNRKYPLIVTLHSETTSPSQQLDWWAGMRKEDDTHERYGQAGRFGYIVMAPEWSDGVEHNWNYSPAQSAAVLYSLRDTLQRFSVDTDRVFLSGHGAGGTGTWDLGLAHPDLWAGIIPICGEAIKYPHYLRKNAEFVPVYGIGGELDGGKLARCKTVLDEGMSRSEPYDMTFVLFKGRGNEPFSDEIIRLFQWMQLRTRSIATSGERIVYAMRPWDNAFWNVEQLQYPEKMMVLPFEWVSRLSHNFSCAETQFFRAAQTNVIRIKSKSSSALIGLSPEYVNFDQPIEVTFNGKKITPANGIIVPDLEVMLNDARTRHDRQHPYWAILDTTTK